MAQRSSKGTVKVIEDKGWLRLRWSFGGRRYTLAMGLSDTPTNRLVAERKAKTIETDLVLEQFDSTLVKYRSQNAGGGSVTVVDLFEQFIRYKARQLDPRSLEKYNGLVPHLRQFFRSKQALFVSNEDGYAFHGWLSRRLSLVTLRERISLLRSCWDWGMKRGLVQENPWTDVRVKVPPKPGRTQPTPQQTPRQTAAQPTENPKNQQPEQQTGQTQRRGVT